MKRQTPFFLLIFVICHPSLIACGYAQPADAGAPEAASVAAASESAEISALKEKVSRKEDLASALVRLTDIYIGKNDYDGLREYLKTLPEAGLKEAPEIYLALAKAGAAQIAHWHKTKDWEGVYDKAAEARKEAMSFLRQAEGLLREDQAALRLEVKYWKWRMAHEEDPEAGLGLFNDLANTAAAANAAPDILAFLSDMEYELTLVAGAEDIRRRLETILVAKAREGVSSADGLRQMAEKFLADGNDAVARELLKEYLSRLSHDKERYQQEASRLAAAFAHDDAGVSRDAAFAEELYEKVAASAGGAALESAEQYRRAFNLDLMGEHAKALAEYKKFIASAPQDPRRGAVYFRMGVLAAYGLKDVASAEEYFAKLKGEFPKDILAAEAVYHLGLFAQHRGDAAARPFYQDVISRLKTAGRAAETEELAQLARERMKELDEKKEMPHGLKLFLDGALKKREAGATPEPEVSLVVLTARPARQVVGQLVTLNVGAPAPETGCMTPAYSYEWSGMLGGLDNVPGVAQLAVSYPTPGLKFVFVAMTGPQGLEKVGFCLIDIIVDAFSAAEPQEEKREAPPKAPEPEKKAQEPDRDEAVSHALETFNKAP